MAQLGGVYRGVVANTADPDARGRVQVRLISVMMSTVWADVCTPVGAPRHAAPSIGSTVLVAFEEGDADHPIVLGVLRS